MADSLTCYILFHRLQRFPRPLHRSLNFMEVDAIDLTDEMLGLPVPSLTDACRPAP